MLTTIGILLFAVGILLSIALHEIGHLVPAKRFGVKVSQYMVGFGPTAWSRRKGETEYGVKWIPLGGYIRMIGMFPPRPGSDPARLRSSSTGPFRALVDSARQASLDEVRPGDEERVFYRLPVRRKIIIMLGGPVMNFLIAAVLVTAVLVGLGLPDPDHPTTTVSSVAKCVVPAAQAQQRAGCRANDAPSPAAAAGLRPGDEIVAFDGSAVRSWDQVATAIRAAGPGPATLSVVRAGQRRDLHVTLAANERHDPATGRIETVGFLGVTPTVALARQPITAVPGFLWTATARTAGAVLDIPARMVGVWRAAFSGQDRQADGPIGIVGVSRIGGEVAAAAQVPLSFKVGDFLLLLASLNLALFVFNLVPLLPLDGGHVAGALFEGARRQVARWRDRPDPGPVDVARMLPVAYTVAVLLIGMSALLLYADVVNPIRLTN